ncbi:hypothetical protein [Myxococcus landrumensis]|uniref:Uncharacterized protein n=1 Tax=Myxococcus landrumensis TaxID=2813577 RepID=A0ABX7NFY1_9BACT|nr:hypothetical protein [Myxococcus landrumus]QSQ17732.1 hypothetical protein JY572_17595 [Myxococcus landrumus]
MDRNEIVSCFNTLYLGDSLLQRVEFRIPEAECRLTFNAGKVLKAGGGSIFEPEARFAPALLSLHGVRSVIWDEKTYQFNSTVVDFGAALSGDGEHIEFHFALSGGTDPDAFLVKLTFIAKAFEFGPAAGCSA